MIPKKVLNGAVLLGLIPPLLFICCNVIYWAINHEGAVRQDWPMRGVILAMLGTIFVTPTLWGFALLGSFYNYSKTKNSEQLVIRFHCPSCNAPLKSPIADRGYDAKCKFCETTFVIPDN